MRLGDPKECRERAAYCAKQANTAASPLAREKFAHMAQVWLHLAIQLEEQWMLLDQWAVEPARDRSNDETRPAIQKAAYNTYTDEPAQTRLPD
jgi:hypothetical protein